MQHIVLLINITLTFNTSIILSIFSENYNEYGHFGRKIQFVHFF